jgi:hypothetical protein
VQLCGNPNGAMSGGKQGTAQQQLSRALHCLQHKGPSFCKFRKQARLLLMPVA